MLKRIALILIAALAVPAVAFAALPPLTIHQARGAIMRDWRHDQTVHIYGCHRVRRERVRCRIAQPVTVCVDTTCSRGIYRGVQDAIRIRPGRFRFDYVSGDVYVSSATVCGYSPCRKG